MYLFYLIGGKIMGEMRLYRRKDIEIPCFTEKEADTYQAFFEFLGIRVKTNIFNVKLLQKVLKGIDKENLKMDFETLREYIKEEYYDELYEEALDTILKVISTYHLEEIMHIIKYELSWKYSKEMKQNLWDAATELRHIYFSENGKNPYIANVMLECLPLCDKDILADYDLPLKVILLDIQRDIEGEYNGFISARINLLKSFAAIKSFVDMGYEAKVLLSLKLDTEEAEKLHHSLFECMSNRRYFITQEQLLNCGRSLVKTKKSIRNYQCLGEAYNRTARTKSVEREAEEYYAKAIEFYEKCIALFEDKGPDTIFDIKAVLEAKVSSTYLLYDHNQKWKTDERVNKYWKFVASLKRGKYLEMIEKQLGVEDAKKWIDKVADPG